MITQEALNIKKRLGYMKSSLFLFLEINKMNNKTYKVQEIFNWFKQFHKEEIKIEGDTKKFEIILDNKSIPHLLGLQYMQPKQDKKLSGREIYNLVKNNKLSDQEIYDKVNTNNAEKLTNVKDRIENFQEFVENLEKSFIVEQTNSNTKIESNYLMIQSKDNLILHLGIRQGKIEDTIEDFSVFKKDSYMETFLVREDFNYFEKSKIMEEVKGIYKYNDEKERFETFTFNDKRIEKSREEDFTIPKKAKENIKDNER